MKFAREEYTDALVAEMLPLFEAHYQEIAAFKDIPLNPHLELYRRMDETGGLRIFTARLGGRLVGYEVFFVANNPHYMDSVQASQDVLYLSQDMRKGLSGYKFMKWVDNEIGCEADVIYQHIKVKHDFSSILKRLGYKDHDKVMARRVR